MANAVDQPRLLIVPLSRRGPSMSGGLVKKVEHTYDYLKSLAEIFHRWIDSVCDLNPRPHWSP
jgi:hypothetical protein